MLAAMQTLIFDIETIGTVESAARAAVEKLAAGREWDLERYAALCPPLARVVCIACMEAPGEALSIYVDASLAPAPLANTVDIEFGDGTDRRLAAAVIACDGEAALLHAFGERLDRLWKDREARVATFNGRGFDLPVLLHRSIAHRVRAGRRVVEQLLAENRFRPQRHIDVMELATHFGASPRWPLAAYAIGYGYRSPKDGMDGAEVTPAVAAGRIAAVAEYCAGDVVATAHVLARLESD